MVALFAALSMTYSAHGADTKKGKELFEQHCTSCHSINSKLIGPALAGVNDRREEAWLLKWIRNSQEMIDAGDPTAVSLKKEYGTVMNSFDFTDEEIKDILAYIETGGEKKADPTTPGKSTDKTNVTTTGGPSGNGVGLGWLIAVIIVALVIITVQIFNVLKLVSQYTKIPFFNPQKTNAILMLLFLVAGMFGVIWEFQVHGPLMLTDNAASVHGEMIDSMFNITLIITMIVFVLTQAVLFIYAFLYRGRPGRKATFYAHNNNLEIWWTIIPAIVLTLLVLRGFNSWSDITQSAPEESTEIEVFAYQFGWKARYAGEDGKLGKADFNLISSSNALGVALKNEYTDLLAETEKKVKELTTEAEFLSRNNNPTQEEAELIAENKDKLKLAKGHMSRLQRLAKRENLFDGTGKDDFIPNEIHVPVDDPVLMKFRARDVIHSAYMPYFRVQMNCVPGMPTQFWFTPTKTTAEMRQILKKQGRADADEFDYYLFCAKICGAAHFNMKIKVVVEEREAYDAWLKEQHKKQEKKMKDLPAKADNAKNAEKQVASK